MSRKNINSSNSTSTKSKKTRKRSGRPQASRSPYIRQLIIEKSYNKLKTPTQISKELGIPRETVSGIIKRYEERGSTDYKRLGGDLRSIIQDVHREFIVKTIDDNTLEQLRVEILDHFSDIKDIGISTLSRFLNDVQRITLKRSTPRKEKRNDKTTVSKRKE